MKEEMGSWGFRRPGGRVGVRNHVAVISAMDLSNSVVRKICSLARGAVPILPNFGRLLLGADAAQHTRTLVGIGANPNVFGALIVSLEPESANRIADGIKEAGKPVRALDLQSTGGSLQTALVGARFAGELILQASREKRERCPLKDVVLSLKCGGTDATSGIAANPAMGIVTDRVVAAGGTVLFSEPSELMGAEDPLKLRAVSPEAAEEILEAIARKERLAFSHGIGVVGTNPTPDNIAGGITTVEEKAFGSLAKTGTVPIQGVVGYATRPSRPGLWLMDGAGPAVEMIAGSVASGATTVLFSTGVGNPVGSPIAPTLRITGRPTTAMEAWENIDVDVSGVTTGKETTSQAGERLFQKLLGVISGELTRGEVFADEEYAISRIGETL